MAKKVRIHNDIDVVWTVSLTKPDGSIVDLSTMSLGVNLIVGTKIYSITEDNAGLTIVGNVISFTFYGNRQEYSGSYILKLYDANNVSITYDTRNAFILVDHSWQAIDVITEATSVEINTTVSVNRVIITTGRKGDKGDKGDPATISSVITIGENGNWYIDGIDTGVVAHGIQGLSGAFKSIVFKRSQLKPETPVGGTYDNPIPEGWYDGIPEGSYMIWASSATFYASGEHTDWSVPVAMKDTTGLDVEFAKEQAGDAQPPVPDENNRHGGSGEQIWFDPEYDVTEDYTKMYWRAERKYENGAWSSWIIMRIKGEKGETGGGQSSFKSIVFTRMNSTPVLPTGGSWSSPLPTSSAGQDSTGNAVYWSDGIPDGTNIIWASSRIFTLDGSSPQQDTWTTPHMISDTATYDVEFAKEQQDDAFPPLPTADNMHGGTGIQVWFDPTLDSDEDFSRMFWRAERKILNGVAHEWTIVRIKGEKGDDGEATDGEDGRSMTSIVYWFKKNSSSSGITPPSTSTNPTTAGWSQASNSIILTSEEPYLWGFVRWEWDDGEISQSDAFVVRYLNPEVEIDYTEVAQRVTDAIEHDTAVGSFNYRIGQLESTSATKTFVNGKITNARTEWQSNDSASIIDAVSKGELYWKHENGNMYRYDHFRQENESLDSAYETRIANLGYIRSVVIDEMSAIRQQSDTIFLGVGSGGDVAAAIKILRDASTNAGKIILDANNVQINGGLTAGSVDSGAIAAGAITADKIAAGVIRTDRLQTGNNDVGAEIYSGIFNIKKDGVVRAKFGIDEGGDVVLQFLDSTGTNILYEFGPNGIVSHITTSSPHYEDIYMALLPINAICPDSTDGSTWTLPTLVHYYRFIDGEVTVGNVTTYYVVNRGEALSSHSQYHGKIFTTSPSNPANASVVADGTYLSNVNITSSQLLETTTNKKIVYDRTTGPLRNYSTISGYNPELGWYWHSALKTTYANGRAASSTTFIFRRNDGTSEYSSGANVIVNSTVITRVNNLNNIESEATNYTH